MTTAATASATTDDDEGHHRHSHTHRASYVVSTSVPHAQVSKTANLQRASSNVEEVAASTLFHKRVFGMLVLQYSTILFLASPFALLPSVQYAITQNHTLHTVLECISTGGIVATMVTAVLVGSKYPATQICLVCVTFFVALDMGISFADGSLGKAGFIAIAQATTSFALILALLQFDFEWLDYPAAYALSLLAVIVWISILLEVGDVTMLQAVGIGMGGFVFVCIVLMSSYTVEKHVAPDEHILATLFILCPEALMCIGSSERHVENPTTGNDEEGQLLVN